MIAGIWERGLYAAFVAADRWSSGGQRGQLRSLPWWMGSADRESYLGRVIEMRTHIEQEAMQALTPTGGFLVASSAR